MDLPDCFPNPEHNAQQIENLLKRVRNLDATARRRLSSMLDEEMDLPYLDVMERQYAQAFQQVAPDHATELRGRFNQALNEQRMFLVGLVRQALREDVGSGLHTPSSDMKRNA